MARCLNVLTPSFGQVFKQGVLTPNFLFEHFKTRRCEVESVVCVSERPKSGSVGRTFPTPKVAPLRTAEGRSVGPLRLVFCAALRAAGGRSVGLLRPNFFRAVRGQGRESVGRVNLACCLRFASSLLTNITSMPISKVCVRFLSHDSSHPVLMCALHAPCDRMPL